MWIVDLWICGFVNSPRAMTNDVGRPGGYKLLENELILPALSSSLVIATTAFPATTTHICNAIPMNFSPCKRPVSICACVCSHRSLARHAQLQTSRRPTSRPPTRPRCPPNPSPSPNGHGSPATRRRTTPARTSLAAPSLTRRPCRRRTPTTPSLLRFSAALQAEARSRTTGRMHGRVGLDGGWM